MAKQIGSQYRETLEEAGYSIYEWSKDGSVILIDSQNCTLELWVPNDHYAGWVIEIGGRGYEFVSSSAGTNGPNGGNR